jgi:hypothetical protein
MVGEGYKWKCGVNGGLQLDPGDRDVGSGWVIHHLEVLWATNQIKSGAVPGSKLQAVLFVAPPFPSLLGITWSSSEYLHST